jgi:RNA polymerase sigma factor (sigma-70 family)
VSHHGKLGTLGGQALTGMAETPEKGRNGAELHPTGASVSAADVMDWFVREVLPLEAILMHFLRQNWRNQADIEDLRQEVYVRICEAAQKELPALAKPFVLMTARNLLINRVRREHVVPIEAVSDLDDLAFAADAPGPERSTIARDELRRLQAAIDALPPRCREAVVLGRMEGLAGREIAARMGVSQQTVSEHLANGIKALAEALHGDTAALRRKM